LLIGGVCTLAALVPAFAVATSSHKPKAAPSYYLALGDSLARGGQPNAAGVTVPTNQGYPNDIYAAEKRKIKGLKLVALGCLGESTTTMIHGHCPGGVKYAAGNQLAEAVKFLRNHKVAFVTLDIGANDVDNCVSGGMISTPCLSAGAASIQTNVPKIVGALRKAAPKVKIVAMTYYDPFLADYLTGSSGQTLAQLSVGLSRQINGSLSSSFTAKKVEVADVAAAFQTYTPFSVTTPFGGYGAVPLPVARICQLTWMCAKAPLGPNIHANVVGYQTIAATFEKVL
jgi:lysophospholipase L1-like esterase